MSSIYLLTLDGNITPFLYLPDELSVLVIRPKR